MIFVKKLHDVEAATINIEMDIALLKIRCDRFPHFHFRMQFFDSTPSGISDAFAMDSRRNKKKIKVAFFTVNFDYYPADFSPVHYYAVGFAAVNGLPNRIPRNDLSILLEVVISNTKLFQCAIIKGFLIIRNKLFSITTFKRNQLYNSLHIFAPKIQLCHSDLRILYYDIFTTVKFAVCICGTGLLPYRRRVIFPARFCALPSGQRRSGALGVWI